MKSSPSSDILSLTVSNGSGSFELRVQQQISTATDVEQVKMFACRSRDKQARQVPYRRNLRREMRGAFGDGSLDAAQS